MREYKPSTWPTPLAINPSAWLIHQRIIVVKMPHSNQEALARVLYEDDNSMRVEWLQAQGCFIRCSYPAGDARLAPIESTLPKPAQQIVRGGVLPVPSLWREL